MKKHGLGLIATNLITSDLPVSDFCATRLFLLIADLHRAMLAFNDSLDFLTIRFQYPGLGIAELLRINCILLQLQTSVWGHRQIRKMTEKPHFFSQNNLFSFFSQGKLQVFLDFFFFFQLFKTTAYNGYPKCSFKYCIISAS